MWQTGSRQAADRQQSAESRTVAARCRSLISSKWRCGQVSEHQQGGGSAHYIRAAVRSLPTPECEDTAARGRSAELR